MELQLNIIGALFILLALFHAGFPRYFSWSNEFKQVSLINRQMMYVHTFFIALTVLLMGVFCLTSSAELVNTSLGRKICLGFAIFWFARLLIQFVWYSPELWKGKRFETIIHILFSLFWMYLTVVFFMVYWGGRA